MERKRRFGQELQSKIKTTIQKIINNQKRNNNQIKTKKSEKEK